MIKIRIGRQSLRKFDKNTGMKFLAVLTPIIIIITLTYVYKCLRMYTIPYVSDGAGHVCVIGGVVYNGNIKIIYLLSCTNDVCVLFSEHNNNQFDYSDIITSNRKYSESLSSSPPRLLD